MELLDFQKVPCELTKADKRPSETLLMLSGSGPHKLLIRIAGVVLGVCCLIVLPSLLIAQGLPVSYASDEDSAPSEMDEKVDSFLDDLEKYADNPEKAMDDLKAWTEEQDQNKKEKSEGILKGKNEQIKVFFGGWMVFFAIVISLFLLKFAFNILCDFLRFLAQKMMEMKDFLLRLKSAWIEDEEMEQDDAEPKGSSAGTSKPKREPSS